jgi:acetylglutamate kinase
MIDAIRKADVLIEALRYIRNFHHRLTLVKLGGSAMEDPVALQATLEDVVFMATVGMRPVLVHGGGKPIDRAMVLAGLTPRKVQGRRYTDEETLAVVVRVLREEVNASLVAGLRELGGRAVGLHGGSLQALFGERLTFSDAEGQPVDLGRVGRVTRVDTRLIEDFCVAGVIPVLPSLALDADGGWLNVNADTAAAAAAAHLRAEKLVFLSDTPGILRDRHDDSSLFSTLTADQCRALIHAGVIEGGMLPKIEACLDSLQAGVRKIHLVDGRLRHSLLLEIFTTQGVGTEILP